VVSEYAYLMVADGEPVNLTLRFPEQFVGLPPEPPSSQYHAFDIHRGQAGEGAGASLNFLGDVFETVFTDGGYVVVTNENIRVELLNAVFNGSGTTPINNTLTNGPFIIMLEPDGNDIFRLNVTLAPTGAANGPALNDFVDVHFRLHVDATGPGATGPAGDFNFAPVEWSARITVREALAPAMFSIAPQAFAADFDMFGFLHCDCHHFSCAYGYNPDCDCPICPQHDGNYAPDYDIDMRKEDDDLHAIVREEELDPVDDDEEDDDEDKWDDTPEGFTSAIEIVYDAYEYLNSPNPNDDHVSGYVGGYDDYAGYAHHTTNDESEGGESGA